MKTMLRSNELSCPPCIIKIEKQLTQTVGFECAKVHFNTRRIEAEYKTSRSRLTRSWTLIGEASLLVVALHSMRRSRNVRRHRSVPLPSQKKTAVAA